MVYKVLGNNCKWNVLLFPLSLQKKHIFTHHVSSSIHSNLHKNPLFEDGKKINAIFHSQFHPCSPLCLEHTKVTNGLNTNSFSKRLQH